MAMGADGIRLPDKLPRGFLAMIVVLWNPPSSVQTTLYYLWAVLNSAIPGDSPPVLKWTASGGGERGAEAHQGVGEDTLGGATVWVWIAKGV